MLFNSYIFILLFFPICLLGFYGIKQKNATAAEIWLTGFSLWFYGYFNLRYLLIMIFSILFNYGVYLLIMRADAIAQIAPIAKTTNTTNANNSVSKKGDTVISVLQNKKTIMLAGVSANLLLLFYFKYYDFFIENVNAVFGSSFALKNILLPLGISFFTFQQISFLVDTYRGELEGCSFVDYALFVSFFPQLIAGPIVTHDEMLPQFRNMGTKKWDEEGFARGLFIFVIGMGKKVLIADTFGLAVDAGYGMVDALGSIDAFLVMIFYSLQLYYDFSGYCDMAIGIGKMMGIEIPINFNSPYKAHNIIEHWKRWHITLSRFFTKNIYIPLGGNRKGATRTYVNLFMVFFLSGIWHGAGWTYIVWGVSQGILYCITKWWHARLKERKTTKVGSIEPMAAEVTASTIETIENKAKEVAGTHTKKSFSHSLIHAMKVLATYLYICVSLLIFRSETLTQAFSIFKRIFTGGIALPQKVIYDPFNLDEFWYVMKILRLTNFSFSNYILMIVFTIVILLVTFFGKNVHEMAKAWKQSWISAVALAIVFIWCVVSLSGVSTFLYFNF